MFFGVGHLTGGFSSSGHVSSTDFKSPLNDESDSDEQGDSLDGVGGVVDLLSDLPGLACEPSELDFSLLQSSISSPLTAKLSFSS